MISCGLVSSSSLLCFPSDNAQHGELQYLIALIARKGIPVGTKIPRKPKSETLYAPFVVLPYVQGKAREGWGLGETRELWRTSIAWKAHHTTDTTCRSSYVFFCEARFLCEGTPYSRNKCIYFMFRTEPSQLFLAPISVRIAGVLSWMVQQTEQHV